MLIVLEQLLHKIKANRRREMVSICAREGSALSRGHHHLWLRQIANAKLILHSRFAATRVHIPHVTGYCALACDEENHTYLKQPESDQIAAWASRGAGLFTDEILQTVRDPTSLSAQR